MQREIEKKRRTQRTFIIHHHLLDQATQLQALQTAIASHLRTHTFSSLIAALPVSSLSFPPFPTRPLCTITTPPTQQPKHTHSHTQIIIILLFLLSKILYIYYILKAHNSECRIQNPPAPPPPFPLHKQRDSISVITINSII